MKKNNNASSHLNWTHILKNTLIVVGLIGSIWGVLAGLRLYINDQISPLSQKLDDFSESTSIHMASLKNSLDTNTKNDARRSIMIDKIEKSMVHLIDSTTTTDDKINYIETLRKEVKVLAENKVDKQDFSSYKQEMQHTVDNISKKLDQIQETLLTITRYQRNPVDK